MVERRAAWVPVDDSDSTPPRPPSRPTHTTVLGVCRYVAMSAGADQTTPAAASRTTPASQNPRASCRPQRSPATSTLSRPLPKCGVGSLLPLATAPAAQPV